MMRSSYNDYKSLKIFSFKQYLGKKSKYEKIIPLSYLIRTMSKANRMAINVEILRIDSWSYLKKEFNELIRVDP